MNRSLLPAPSSVDPLFPAGFDIAAHPQPEATNSTMIGLCTQAGHPDSEKLVEVMWTSTQPDVSAGQRHSWMPRLHHISVEAGDYVLFTRPANAPEAVVIGVLDRPRRRATIELGSGQAVLDGVPPMGATAVLTASAAS